MRFPPALSGSSACCACECLASGGKTRDTVASFLSANALLRRVDIVAHHGFTGVHIASAYTPDGFFYQFLAKDWIVLNAGLYRLFEITCKCHISLWPFSSMYARISIMQASLFALLNEEFEVCRCDFRHVRQPDYCSCLEFISAMPRQQLCSLL